MTNREFLQSISLPNEEWKDVVGFEGKYMVSSLGRVVSLSFPIEAGKLHYQRNQIIKRQKKEQNGYLSTGLSVGRNRNRTVKVHRLVASAFLPNPDNLPVINHLDEDKTNNRVDNLEWSTTRSNINYGTGTERSTRTRIATFCNCKKVAKLDNDGNILRVYNGLRYAAEDIHRDYSAISGAIKRGGKCAGFYWSFL